MANVISGQRPGKVLKTKLIDALMKQKEWGIIKHHVRSPEVKSTLTMKHALTQEKQVVEAERLINMDHVLFLKLIEGAYHRRSIIIDEFGKMGERMLNLMIDLEVAKEDRDGKLHFFKERMNINIYTHKRLALKLLNENYRPQTFGISNNWLSNQSILCDKKVLAPKILNVLKDANKRIRELMKEHEGIQSEKRDVLFVSLFSDAI
ncbi:MAG: hypothetical protein Fur0010_28280 [Bdellovibrio sp.]